MNSEITANTEEKKSNRLNYARIKELCEEAESLRVELNKSQPKSTRDRLDGFIENIRKLSKSSSKHLNTDEINSDAEWIVEYYQKGEWSNVTRWLSNINSSLREMWSGYMDSLNKIQEQEIVHE